MEKMSTGNAKNIGVGCSIFTLVIIIMVLVYNIMKAPLSITVHRAADSNANDHGYYEIVGDVDLYSQDGDFVPNCVHPRTYTNNDLSDNVIDEPSCFNIVNAADSIENNFDSISGGNSGSFDSISGGIRNSGSFHSSPDIDFIMKGGSSSSSSSSSSISDSDSSDDEPSNAPSNAPTLAPTQAPTLAPTKAPTQAPTLAPSNAPTQAPTLAPSNAPTQAPTLAPTKAPTLAPTKAPTQAPTLAPTKAPTQPPTFSGGYTGGSTAKSDYEIYDYDVSDANYNYYQAIKENLRWGIGNEPEHYGLTAHRNMIILNNDDGNDEQKRRLFRNDLFPATKFNEHVVNASYLFDNSYIFDIPQASLNLLMTDTNKKNMNKQILNKLENKNILTNELIIDYTSIDFDYNKYSPFCNLENNNDKNIFFEINSDFLYNTKVYLPDPNTNLKSNCHGYITKSIYDSQAYISRIQNRQSNSIKTEDMCEKQLYYAKGNWAGIGAQITEMGYQFAYSLSKGYKMVLGYLPLQHVNESINEFITAQVCDVHVSNVSAININPAINWDCFLNPISICDNYSYEAYKFTNNVIKDIYYMQIHDTVPYDLFTHPLGEVFWHSQLIKYLFNPNQKINDMINKYKQKLDFIKYRSEGIIGVHIRHGDVCSKTKHRWHRKCNSFDDYMFYINKMNKLYGYKNVYIATDDQAIINQIESNKDMLNKYNFIYTDFNRHIYVSDEWIELRKDINYNTVYIEAIIDIIMLSECSALIGTFSSNLSRIAYLLMIANSGGYKPYASLDTTWCMLDKGGFPC